MKLKTIIKIVVGVVIPPVGMVLISIFILNRAPVKHKMKTGIGLTVLWSALLVAGYIGSKQDEAEALDRGITLSELKDERNDKRLAKAAGFETIAEHKADIEIKRIESDRIAKARKIEQERLDAIAVPRGYSLNFDKDKNNYDYAVEKGLKIKFVLIGSDGIVNPEESRISINSAKDTVCRDIVEKFERIQFDIKDDQKRWDLYPIEYKRKNGWIDQQHIKDLFKLSASTAKRLSDCIYNYQESNGVAFINVWEK